MSETKTPDDKQKPSFMKEIPPCGCGKRGRYMTETGMACNKYRRCNTRSDLRSQ